MRVEESTVEKIILIRTLGVVSPKFFEFFKENAIAQTSTSTCGHKRKKNQNIIEKKKCSTPAR